MQYHANRRAAWTVADLNNDPSWIVELDEQARADLIAGVRAGADPAKSLFDYRRSDFALGSAAASLHKAMKEARDGTGFVLVRGLPRDGVTQAEFELLTWALGLHTGVARPQGKASQYLSAVRDSGTVYRSGKGRGYSSNSDLDFHVDSGDVVLLTCYNVAKSGGMSMVTSSVAARETIQAERPDLADVLRQPFWFSRQQEEAPDETPAYPNPVFDWKDGLWFGKWNRNRLRSALAIEGVPPLTDIQQQALDYLDAVLRRPDLMFAMDLRPGDMQIMNNHVILHSRTEFQDHDDPALKRSLFRLWLATPDGVDLPESWRPAFRSVKAGSVRGGIRGLAYDDVRAGYEARQAADLGMVIEET